WIGSLHQMEASEQDVDMCVYLGRRLENLLDTRVRTPVHDDQTLWTANGHGDFTEFQCVGNLRDGWHKKNARHNLRHRIHADEIRLRPRPGRGKRTWRIAVEVARIRRQRFVLAVETGWRRPRERPPGVCRSVDLHRRVDAQQVIDAADVV